MGVPVLRSRHNTRTLMRRFRHSGWTALSQGPRLPSSQTRSVHREAVVEHFGADITNELQAKGLIEPICEHERRDDFPRLVSGIVTWRPACQRPTEAAHSARQGGGWIGVDLDGTLSEHYSLPSNPVVGGLTACLRFQFDLPWRGSLRSGRIARRSLWPLRDLSVISARAPSAAAWVAGVTRETQ